MKKLVSLLAAFSLVSLMMLASCASSSSASSSASTSSSEPPSTLPVCAIETLVPQAGDQAKFYLSGTMQLDGKTFPIEYINWVKPNGDFLMPTDTFEENQSYQAILFIPSAHETIMTDPSLYDFKLRPGYSLVGLGEGNEDIFKLVLEITCQDLQAEAGHSHTYVSDKAVSRDASCFDDGYAVRSCTSCEAHTIEELPMYNEHKVPATFEKEIAPTCTEEGVRAYTCTRCGGYILESIPVVDHKWEYSNSTDPDCTHNGYHTYRCSYCKQVYSDTVAPLGHDWHWAATTDPTCFEEGIKYYECYRCGAEKTEGIPQLAHDWQHVATTNPTCQEDGILYYECYRCGAEKTAGIPASSAYHSFIFKDFNPQQHARVCEYCDALDLNYGNNGVSGHRGDPGTPCLDCGYLLPTL